MRLIFSKKSLRFCGLILSLGLFGCVSNRPSLYHITEFGKIEQKTLERLLWENSLSPGQTIMNRVLLTTDSASYHLVQIQGSEKPHKYESHDMAIFIQSGSGLMVMGKGSFKAGPGSIIFVPHDTPHYFTSAGNGPAVAIVVFTPPYDGKDQVPVDESYWKKKNEKQ